MPCSKLTVVFLITAILVTLSFSESARNKTRRKVKSWNLNTLSLHTDRTKSFQNKAAGFRPSNVRRPYSHRGSIKSPKGLQVQKKGFKADGLKDRTGLRKKFQRTRKRSKFIRSNMNRPRTRSLKMIRESLPVKKKGAALKDVGTKGNPRFYKNPARKRKAKLSKAHWSKKSTQKLRRKKGQHLKNGVTGKSSNSKRKTRSRRKKSKILSQKTGRRGSKLSSTRNRARKTDRKNSQLSTLKMKASNISIPNFVSLEGVKPPERVKDKLRKAIRKRKPKRLGKGKNSKTGTALNSPTNLKLDNKTERPLSDAPAVVTNKETEKPKKPGLNTNDKKKRIKIKKKKSRWSIRDPNSRKRKSETNSTAGTDDAATTAEDGNDTSQDGNDAAEDSNDENGSTTDDDTTQDNTDEDGDTTDDGSGDAETGETVDEPKKKIRWLTSRGDDMCRYERGPLRGKCVNLGEAIKLLGGLRPDKAIYLIDYMKVGSLATNLWYKYAGKPIDYTLNQAAGPALKYMAHDTSISGLLLTLGELTSQDQCKTLQNSMVIQDGFFNSIADPC